MVTVVASAPHFAMVVDSAVTLKPGAELFTVALGPKEEVCNTTSSYTHKCTPIHIHNVFVGICIACVTTVCITVSSRYFLLFTELLPYCTPNNCYLCLNPQGWKPFGTENMFELSKKKGAYGKDEDPWFDPSKYTGANRKGPYSSSTSAANKAGSAGRGGGGGRSVGLEKYKQWASSRVAKMSQDHNESESENEVDEDGSQAGKKTGSKSNAKTNEKGNKKL
jgi:hypothetical protein